jgi:hypothetical protein
MNIGIEDGAAAFAVKLGLTQNWSQFALLLLVNAFVGCMVSIERTVVPLIGSEDFHIASTTRWPSTSRAVHGHDPRHKYLDTNIFSIMGSADLIPGGSVCSDVIANLFIPWSDLHLTGNVPLHKIDLLVVRLGVRFNWPSR